MVNTALGFIRFVSTMKRANLLPTLSLLFVHPCSFRPLLMFITHHLQRTTHIANVDRHVTKLTCGLKSCHNAYLFSYCLKNITDNTVILQAKISRLNF